MGISCKLVEDSALAALPRFGELREFVSIDVSDAGFRHVGQCENLESLYCMYCRDTGDDATRAYKWTPKAANLLCWHDADYRSAASRSLDRWKRFEHLEFWQCMKITDAGVAHLAALPRLQRIEIYNSPNVSQKISQLFRETVQVRYSG